MKRSAVGELMPNGSFDRLLASQWTRRRGPETMAITIDRGKVSVMPDELRPDLVYAMADAVDKMLLSWEPAPSLSEVISALVQSLARALSATTDPGPSLATVKDGVEHLLVKFCAPGAANQIDMNFNPRPIFLNLCLFIRHGVSLGLKNNLIFILAYVPCFLVARLGF